MNKIYAGLTGLCLVILLTGSGLAHPLGQFSINHYARILSSPDRIEVRYVVDLAEVPTFQEARVADIDVSGSLSREELNGYLDRVTPGYLSNLLLTIDGRPASLELIAKEISLVPGQSGSAAMGLATLRIVFDLAGRVESTGSAVRFRFEDRNNPDRPGWREMVLMPLNGASIFDSNCYGSGMTDELKTYPEDLITAPLNERFGEWSAVRGPLPPGAKPLTMRDGRPVVATRDRFAELIAAPELTLPAMLIGLLFAFVLGGMHAMSPGHGKAMVGAYLVGSRGTAGHAAFLGLTVTTTHTIGVFALGLITLLASSYILPEKLLPVLSLISGGLILAIGLSLLVKRLDALLGVTAHEHAHRHDHVHGSEDLSHGHAHLPPVGDHAAVTWRSLLALGISGGIMPCPSALVIMLAAISLDRVGYGLILIVAFSLGLATVLTAVGLAFVYAGKLISSINGAGQLMRILPVISSLVILVIGGTICYQALRESGIDPVGLWNAELESAAPTSALVILGWGLLIGLRHALDTDHLAAVSAIVCEQKNLFSSLLIGGLWGLGHTISLIIAGVGVILLNFKIDRYEKVLEFCVALMLIILGLNVLYKLSRGRKIHHHVHHHGKIEHDHPHLHNPGDHPARKSHDGLKLGPRPLIIGMIHGMAGSAALMLAVLATIKSTAVAFGYIAIFGLGSIGGMMVMSLILSLPARLTGGYFNRANLAVRALAGVFSLGFGLFLAYEIGIKEGLLR